MHVMGLPARVKEIAEKLDPENRKAFEHHYMRRRKSLLIAYLLCLLGWHYLYLGKIGLQFAFFISVGGFLLWLLVDLFRLPGMVARQNEGIAGELLSLYRTDDGHIGKLADFLK